MNNLAVNKNTKKKENFADNQFHNIFRLLMFYQIFLSPSVKRCAIIPDKHVIYELPHEFSNDLRLRILGHEKISGKCLNFKG